MGRCGAVGGVYIVQMEGDLGTDRGGGAALEEEEGSASVHGWEPVSVVSDVCYCAHGPVNVCERGEHSW